MFELGSPPHRVTLILLTALSILSLNMFLPSLANMARDFEADYAIVSLAVAGYLAVTAVVHLIVGRLSDRLGRRPVLLAALIVFILASLACSLAEDVWTFLGFRMLQAGMVSGSALSMVIVRDTTSAQKAAGTIGYISMAMALAPMLGPVLGGGLDTAFGWRSIFHFYALSGLCLLALCWVDLGETRPDRPDRPDRNDGQGEGSDTMSTLVREPKFWAYAFCTAFSTGAFFIFLAGAPLVADAAFGVTTAEVGLFIGSITAGFMLGAFLAGRFAPRYSLAAMMMAGRLVACGGLLLGLAVLGIGWLSPVSFFGSTIFVGLGNGITMPSSNTGVMSVRPGLAGSAAGMNAALNVSSGAVLTTLTGLILTRSNAPHALLILMLAASAAGLLAALLAIRFERRERETAGRV